MTAPTPPPGPVQSPDPAALSSAVMAPATSSWGAAQLALVAVALVVGGAATFLMLSARPAAPSAEPEASVRAVPAEARSSSPYTPSHSAAAGAHDTRWSRANEYRWVSNHKRSVAYELEAAQQVKVWTTAVRPLLVVRCLSRKTEVFVYTETPAKLESGDGTHTVELTFDSAPSIPERWPDSEEHDALFAPDGTSLARRLATAHHLRFGFTPHNAPPVTVDFDLGGGDAVVANVARTCGWH